MINQRFKVSISICARFLHCFLFRAYLDAGARKKIPVSSVVTTTFDCTMFKFIMSYVLCFLNVASMSAFRIAIAIRVNISQFWAQYIQF
jgi:hypothetical protein